MYYLETHSQDPGYNLAFEEYVLTKMPAGEYFLLWQNDNAIVIGQNQNAAEEIDSAYVEAHSIRLVRRATGGGAVYHDLGNLNYSFIREYNAPGTLTMESFEAPLLRALQKLGLDAHASGRNDILIGQQKVSGTAQRIAGGRVLFHGTLLFDSDLGVLAGALRTDPAKFTGKSTKSVRSRVGNIRPLLKADMDLPAFWNYLKKELSAEYEELRLSEEALLAVEALNKSKYSSEEWTYGRSPACTLRVKRRFPGGTVEALLEVKQGRITDGGFYGDFLSQRPLDPVIERLKGCFFERQAVSFALSSLKLGEYFGSVTGEELLSLLFDSAEE